MQPTVVSKAAKLIKRKTDFILFCDFLPGFPGRSNRFSLANNVPFAPGLLSPLTVNELQVSGFGHTLSGPCNLHLIVASILRFARDAGGIPPGGRSLSERFGLAVAEARAEDENAPGKINPQQQRHHPAKRRVNCVRRGEIFHVGHEQALARPQENRRAQGRYPDFGKPRGAARREPVKQAQAEETTNSGVKKPPGHTPKNGTDAVERATPSPFSSAPARPCPGGPPPP